MSFFFKSSNQEKAIELFQKSLIYNLEIQEPEYENLISFFEAERYLYGRVNYYYMPIIYDKQSVPLSTLISTNTNENNLLVAPYVAAAFNDLNQQFLKKTLSGELDTDDEFLANLEVKSAYIDPLEAYNAHFASIQEVFLATTSPDQNKFSNFEEFLPIFDKTITEVSRRIPVTLPGYVKSRFCPMNVSGLVIEIADIDYANDEEKIAKFKQSRNWKFYLNACRSYGFYVDSTNPFRLIANIGSPEMLEYARSVSTCLFTSTNDILAGCYKPCYENYINYFKQIFYNMYNLAKVDKYLDIKQCNDGSVITREIEPVEYSFETFTSLIGDTYFLKKYIDLRINEEPHKFKEGELKSIVASTMNLAKSRGVERAIARFEKIIGQTYSYSGSLTDLVNRAKLRDEEDMNVLSNT
jgi:hypothetical protein|tara:strand:+ start:743 stop:1975 length:1233 start_codon:yes stop_codon:yes gene_type:complete